MISIKSLFRSLPVVLAALTAAGSGELRAQNRLIVSPTALTFNYATGASQPAGQDIQVTSTDTVSYAITPTSSGWLSVSPTPGITAGVAHVTINPSGLVVGTYMGNLRFDANGVTNSPINVPVTLNVTAGGTSTTSQLVATPASLAFTAQTGGSLPLAQNVSVASNTSTAITYTISTSSGSAWLSAAANGGTTTPGNVTVAVNQATLPAGTYNGSVILTPTTGGGTAQTIPVSLTVNSTASLTTSATALSFNFQTNRATPPSQTITIGSTLGTLNFTATASATTGNWLSIFPNTGSTPSALTVSANPTGLPVGTYTGNISVTAPGSANSLSISVTLVVSNSALLNVSPASVNFQYFGGAAPSPVPVSVTSTGDILVYTATVTPGATWLRVNGTNQVGGTTPSTFNLSVDPAFLPGGVATANVTIATSSNPTAFVIPVTVNGSSPSTITVTPSQLAFSAVLGGSSPTFQSFSVLSNDNTSQQFTLSSTSTNNFLFVQQNQFATPATVNVGVNLGAITTPGTYTGTITVTPVNSSTGGTTSPAVVTVTLTVTGNTAVTATPASLTFTPPAGNTTPQTQTIQLSSTVSGVSFLASASTTAGNWLSVVSNSTGLPATLSVTANPAGLAVGRYDGTVTVVTSGGQQPLTIPVTLTVASPATIAVSPATLTFAATAGGAAPPVQTIQISGSLANTTFSASAVANSGGNWLDVNPKSGVAPATVTVSVNPSGLAAGQYTGSISIIGNGTSNSPQTVNVVLNVTAATLPLINSVVNAATFSPTAIAPGEIVTIFGTNMGPSAIVGLRLNASSGLVDTTLSDTQVLFDGIPAPLVYVSANQIAAIVPYNVFARLSTRVQVVYQGQASTALELRVVDTAPGVFTLNSQGTGNAAALNQNGTVNGPQNPAIQGQAVVLYLTGEGQTNPQGVNGQVSSGANLKRPTAFVSAKIGGVPAIVDYAGSAPGLVSGVMQLNLRVPSGLPSGPALVEVTIGSAQPVSNATISVQ